MILQRIMQPSTAHINKTIGSAMQLADVPPPQSAINRPSPRSLY